MCDIIRTPPGRAGDGQGWGWGWAEKKTCFHYAEPRGGNEILHLVILNSLPLALIKRHNFGGGGGDNLTVGCEGDISGANLQPIDRHHLIALRHDREYLQRIILHLLPRLGPLRRV